MMKIMLLGAWAQLLRTQTVAHVTRSNIAFTASRNVAVLRHVAVKATSPLVWTLLLHFGITFWGLRCGHYIL